jgi:apolipoprotein N-acyltransferase
LPLPYALLFAIAGGFLLDAAFPDRAVWILAFPAIALLLLSLRGRRVGGAAIVGAAGGSAFYFMHIEWASLFLGPLPMAALAGLQSLLFALGAIAISLAYRWFSPGTRASALVSVIVGGIWLLRETVAGTWPYGGFAWGRLGVSQVDGPISQMLSWVGIPGLGFLMVTLVALTIEAVIVQRARWRRIFVASLLATLMVALPTWPTSPSGTLRIAAIQGAGPAGYFDEREAGALLDAQVRASNSVYGEELDLVIWPEGSTDRDPLTDANTADALTEVAREAGAPLIAWGVTERDEQTFNSALLWTQAGTVDDIYDKRHPVPFGEYVPDRAFWRPFAPSLIDLIQREYSPGTTDPIFSVSGVPIGVTICFDIVDDALLSEAAGLGAELIVASSNNADFGRTDEAEQQLAIARARAIELSRTVINVSTVGVTAAISPDGRVFDRLTPFVAGELIADVSLRTGQTPAAMFGQPIAWVLSLLSLLALTLGAVSRLRAPYSLKTHPTPERNNE